MAIGDNVRALWQTIRNETQKNANTAERVGAAGEALVDLVETMQLTPGPQGDKGDKGDTGEAGADGTSTETIAYALSDQATDITTGVKLIDRMPYPFTITGILASLAVAATGGSFTVNIKKNDVTIFTTKLTFDSGEASTATAAIPYVLSTTTFAANDKVEFSVDSVGSVTAGKGLIVKLIGTK